MLNLDGRETFWILNFHQYWKRLLKKSIQHQKVYRDHGILEFISANGYANIHALYSSTYLRMKSIFINIIVRNDCITSFSLYNFQITYFPTRLGSLSCPLQEIVILGSIIIRNVHVSPTDLNILMTLMYVIHKHLSDISKL